MLKILLIGIYDRNPDFSDEIKEKISAITNFAGGKRHYELVKEWLPAGANWTTISIPLDNLFDKIRIQSGNWVVFASGDPLFFGIGNTLKREFPAAELISVPVHNSLQLLAYRYGINYGAYKTVSLTGRDWYEFDKVLLQGEKRIGVLTDRKNTPASIATRMLEFGYDNYRMYYGECLGGNRERIAELSLQEAKSLEFQHPNCFFLKKEDDETPKKGIHEQDFEILNGRPKMITKLPVRLVTIAALELHNKKILWDIGACTGSISIESRLHFPHIKVVAFERREESRDIIQKNIRKFQTPGIRLFIGDYLEIEKEELEKPDAVFLGGYSGEMEQILNDVNHRLNVGGVIVFNSVSENSQNNFLDWGRKNKYEIRSQQRLVVDDQNPIKIIALKKLK